ncbi:MAG: hypothetical protein ACON4Y_05815 [Flavobacteriales bacterium]
MLQDLKLNTYSFTLYKFFNSLFLGVSLGSVFTIYEPLDPKLFSAGGIFLAVSTLAIARFYKKILTANYFYKISLFVEIIVLLIVLKFLIFSFNPITALSIYIGYQITFIFGSYLVRAETLVLNDDKILTKVDSAKQLGYLLGMLVSFCFYQLLEQFMSITSNQEQVYLIHYLLLLIEILVIFFLIKSFKKVGV